MIQEVTECAFIDFAWLVPYFGLNGETYRALVRNTLMNLNTSSLWNWMRTLTNKIDGLAFKGIPDSNFQFLMLKEELLGYCRLSRYGGFKISLGLEANYIRWEPQFVNSKFTNYVFILQADGRRTEIDRNTFFQLFQERVKELMSKK
jgi:hypothetical protein